MKVRRPGIANDKILAADIIAANADFIRRMRAAVKRGSEHVRFGIVAERTPAEEEEGEE